MRTNCNNCGAVLKDGKCEYCGTQWFTPGFRLGEHGFVTEATFTQSAEPIDNTRHGDTWERFLPGLKENSVELKIVGLKDEEVTKLYEAIRNGFGKAKGQNG